MITKQKIFISGHNGMVGKALVRAAIHTQKFDIITATRNELDLTSQSEVENYLLQEKPEVIMIAAAKVGGIYANSHYPANFIQENLSIALNLIHGAHKANINHVLFLGSSTPLSPHDSPSDHLTQKANS